jgi:hypothetical protein
VRPAGQPPPAESQSAHGVAFWVAVAVGIAIAGYGVKAYLDKYSDWGRRLSLARWIIGVDLAHDLLFAPLVLVAGVLARRVTPSRAWAPVQFGLMASGVVLLVAWRPSHASAAYKHNPTAQPLDYATATVTVVAGIWVIAALWFAIHLLRRSRSHAKGGSG